jgi:hypothetical protein
MPPLLIKQQNQQVTALSAPTGGWNARDPLAKMKPLDAVRMTNMFPTVSSVVLRGGYQNHVTGFPSQVESLMAYQGGATSKLFAASGTSFYDATSAGVVGAAVVTGLTNARWEYTNVTTSGGSYLYTANGVDAPRLYDGTNWITVTGASAPAITGVTTTTLHCPTLFKNRVWFIQANTLKAWYLPTSSVGGAAASLDLSAVFRKGGYLVAMGAWTLDAGYGADDNLVFITSQGEVVVYRGTDPSSSSTWAQAGLWEVGAPISRRCMMKYGGDILILTYDGLLPLSEALQSSRLDPRVALTDKIQGAVADVTKQYGTSFGWGLFFNAKNNALWINVPVPSGAQEQYVMNTITKNWGQFEGWPANCWEQFSNDPYFGGNTVVCKAWTSDYADNNTAIQTDTLQAFNYFQNRGAKKYFTRARPSVATDGVPSVFIGMNVDFDTSDTTQSLSFSPTTYGLWDSGTWDTSVWGSGLSITNNWQGIAGIGTCGAVHFKTSSKGLQIQWNETDVVYQNGWAGM